MLPFLKISGGLLIADGELIVMKNWVVSQKKLGWRIAMNPNFPSIHRMNHLIQVGAPLLDLASSDHNLPDSIQNQLDISFQQSNRRGMSFRSGKLSNPTCRQEFQEYSIDKVRGVIHIDASR